MFMLAGAATVSVDRRGVRLGAAHGNDLIVERPRVSRKQAGVKVEKGKKPITEEDAKQEIKREVAIGDPVDPEAVDKVIRTLPEFAMAYEPDGIKVEDFDAFGATGMTLASFDITGWQKLRNMDIPR